MKWYYAEAGVQRGPVEDEEFQQLTLAGTIRPDTLVWRDGMPAWERWDKVSAPPPPPLPDAAPAANGATAPEGARFCSHCGKPYAASALVPIGEHLICVNCKPSFLQGLREGRHAAGNTVYAGFWIRFFARLIDGVILGIVSGLVQVALLALTVGGNMGSLGRLDRDFGPSLAILGLMYLVGIAINLAYEVYFLVNRGGTPGKLILNMKVIRSDGERLTTGRAVGRFFGNMLSGLTIGIGYIIAGIDDQKRALHDHICDTRVIRTN